MCMGEGAKKLKNPFEARRKKFRVSLAGNSNEPLFASIPVSFLFSFLSSLFKKSFAILAN